MENKVFSDYFQIRNGEAIEKLQREHQTPDLDGGKTSADPGTNFRGNFQNSANTLQRKTAQIRIRPAQIYKIAIVRFGQIVKNDVESIDFDV